MAPRLASSSRVAPSLVALLAATTTTTAAAADDWFGNRARSLGVVAGSITTTTGAGTFTSTTAYTTTATCVQLSVALGGTSGGAQTATGQFTYGPGAGAAFSFSFNMFAGDTIYVNNTGGTPATTGGSAGGGGAAAMWFSGGPNQGVLIAVAGGGGGATSVGSGGNAGSPTGSTPATQGGPSGDSCGGRGASTSANGAGGIGVSAGDGLPGFGGGGGTWSANGPGGAGGTFSSPGTGGASSCSLASNKKPGLGWATGGTGCTSSGAGGGGGGGYYGGGGGGARTAGGGCAGGGGSSYVNPSLSGYSYNNNFWLNSPTGGGSALFGPTNGFVSLLSASACSNITPTTTPASTGSPSGAATESSSPSPSFTSGLDPSMTSSSTASSSITPSGSITPSTTPSNTASPSFTPVVCDASQVTVPAVPFQPAGVSIVAVRVGTGATNLLYPFGNGTTWPSLTMMPAFVDELSLSTGAVLQSIPLPSTTSSDNTTRRCNVGVGNSYNEGNGALSFDGVYYSVPCWDVEVGKQASATATRTIARLDTYGNVDTTTSWVYDAPGVPTTLTAHISALFNGTGFYTTNQGGTRFIKYGAPWNGGASTFTSGSARALTAAYGYVWQASTSPSINRWTQAGATAGSPGLTAGKMTGLSSSSPQGIAVQNATRFWVCDNSNVLGLYAYTVLSNGTALPLGNMVIPATGEPVANPVPQAMVTRFDFNGVSYNAPGCRGMSGYVDSATGHYTLVYATGAPMFLAGVTPQTSNFTGSVNSYSIGAGNFIVKFDTYTYTATAIARACGNTEYKGVALAPQPGTPTPSPSTSSSASASITSSQTPAPSTGISPSGTAASTAASTTTPAATV